MLFPVVQDNERMNQWTNLSVMKRFSEMNETWLWKCLWSLWSACVSPPGHKPSDSTSRPRSAGDGTPYVCSWSGSAGVEHLLHTQPHRITHRVSGDSSICVSLSSVKQRLLGVTHTHTRSLQEVLSADVPHRFLRFTQNRQNMQELLIRERRRAAVSLHDPGEKKQNTLIQSFMNIWLHTKIPLYYFYISIFFF